MVKNFDLWAISDGLSGNAKDSRFLNILRGAPKQSTDGTVEYLTELSSKNSNVLFFSSPNGWRSKTDEVNHAVCLIKQKLSIKHKQESYINLWQVDADEHWTIEKIQAAEKMLSESGHTQVAFGFNHYVGEGLIAVGQWGSDKVSRLFKWRGEKFMSHEPAVIHRRPKVLQADSIKFDHYSYYFEKDVIQKDVQYINCNGLHKNWKTLQELPEFPQPISALFPKHNPISKLNAQIIKL